jgi:hypothetical protein
MNRRICRLLFSCMLMLTTSALASTLYVGTCHSNSYSTISAAVAVAPPGATIEVCPGRYAEQIVITQALTVKGISSSNGELIIVVAPPPGLMVNAQDDMGDAIAAQLLVEVNPGPVQISNVTFDASNNQVSSDAYIAGIFFQSSAGTINHVVTRNQIGGDGGVGVWIEGGASNPRVTLENSSIHDFDDIGIWTQTNAASSQLTAIVERNFVNGETSSGLIAPMDVALGKGSTNTASDNYLASGQTGVFVSGGASGTVAGNNLVINGGAIAIGGDGLTGGTISVTNNDIFYSSVEGIVVNGGLPAVQHNTIAHVPIGIEFACNADGNVKSNTIMDTSIAIDNLPVGFSSSNSYFNVQAITGGGCGR